MITDEISCKRRDSVCFFSIFITLFIIMNVAFYYFLSMAFEIWIFLYVSLLELVAFGFAYEITQLFLSLFLKEIRLPFVKKLDNYPPVALLCTTCDNINTEILKNLNRQTYPNLHIFILDDSQDKESQVAVDSLYFSVLRRSNRYGYKAGSLNNWLMQYGQNFPYFIVVDADSLLPDNFVEQMIAYAEHPNNSGVAIFESLISAWNDKNQFARLLGTMTPVMHHYKLCLDNRFCSSLSVGHNNLYRTSIINMIGGFKEDYLAEDYATSIEVLRMKYFCMTVPVPSFERLPENSIEFVRRQSRWTIQTFQLMSLKTISLSWYTRLSILMTLHYYFMPVLALFGMVILMYLNINNYYVFNTLSLPLDFVSIESLREDKTLIFWVTYIILPIFLRGILARREGISVRHYFNSIFFHGALFSASLWPVIRRPLAFWDKSRFHFNVTILAPCPSFQQIILLNVPGFILIWIASLSIALNPIWSGLNLFWAIPAFLSPFLIHYIQRRNYGE